MSGNWVDLVILLSLVFFVYEGLRLGLWIILADFFSFGLSLIIALRGYPLVAQLLRTNFSLSHSVSNALGFLLTALVTEAVFGVLFARAISSLPKKLWGTKWSKILGIVPAVGEALILISFILTLVIAFPVAPSIKKDIAESKIGSTIISETSGIEKRLSDIFGGVIEDSLTYFTVKPQSREAVPLTVETNSLTADEKAEAEMFNLVNTERQKVGLKPLAWSSEIVPVSRAHAVDMWEKKYFGHISPEGRDVGDRLNSASINYSIAGENLALAPTTTTAHTGLMNSEGHRANILEARFTKIGIGVIDNGYYGKMFVQVFTD